VSWQLATFAILGIALVGGFVWYERSRPPARLLGLVAALAALAAAGRVVFSPVPNVVPTTDIAFLSGYSLGGPAGFVVGALAGLVSNFWLGQGPWTPWQMAGWGLAGLAGAALARAGYRRAGRIGLAAACAAMAFVYGALLDLSVMVTYGGEQSLERYLALSARGLPFNVAHAAGNAAFALLAGPAFVRILRRFRSRLEFEWADAPPRPRRAIGTAGAAGILVALVLALTVAAPVAHAGDAAARRYLERAQNRDGGLPATPGDESSVSITGWAMLGLEASGRNPLDLRRNGRSPVGFLRSTVSAIRSTGDLERTILALDAAGVSPRSFAGRDLVGELNGRRSGNGSFQGQVNLTAFGVLALRSVGTPRSSVRRPAEWLRRAQNRDGGWGFRPDSKSESDSTGAALQALKAAGNTGRALSRGAAYLRGSQRGDGGWSLAFGGPTNSQSTAWAVQGLIASGASPNVSKGSRTPFDYLRARQSRDGHYRYSSVSDQTPVWVTGQSLVATSREPFPLAAVPRAKDPGGLKAPPAGPAKAPGLGTGGGGVDGSGGGSRKGGGPGRATGGGGGAGGEADAEAPAGAVAGVADEVAPTVAEEPGTSPYGQASGDGGPGPALWIALGMAALAAALVGGFFWYRRRLP
jgi:energy-coupling factor transport system substrate-specific component